MGFKPQGTTESGERKEMEERFNLIEANDDPYTMLINSEVMLSAHGGNRFGIYCGTNTTGKVVLTHTVELIFSYIQDPKGITTGYQLNPRAHYIAEQNVGEMTSLEPGTLERMVNELNQQITRNQPPHDYQI